MRKRTRMDSQLSYRLKEMKWVIFCENFANEQTDKSDGPLGKHNHQFVRENI